MRRSSIRQPILDLEIICALQNQHRHWCLYRFLKTFIGDNNFLVIIVAIKFDDMQDGDLWRARLVLTEKKC